MWEFLNTPSDAVIGLLGLLTLLASLGLVRLLERVREIGS